VTFLESPRFPDNIAFGATVGPTYMTVVTPIYSGRESRTIAWTQARCHFDVGRRMMNAQLLALTAPLITTSSGAKMGKTAAGAVWLNAGRVSPYDYWQFWRNTEDKDVGRFLRLFTDMPEAEVARLEALEGAELNDAKKVLATEATAILHGRAAAAAAKETARSAFEDGASAAGLPTITAALPDGILNLAVAAGLAASNSEARKLIANNGLKLNDMAVSDPKLTVDASALNSDGVLKLSSGKKKHVLVKPA